MLLETDATASLREHVFYLHFPGWNTAHQLTNSMFSHKLHNKPPNTVRPPQQNLTPGQAERGQPG